MIMVSLRMDVPNHYKKAWSLVVIWAEFKMLVGVVVIIGPLSLCSNVGAYVPR